MTDLNKLLYVADRVWPETRWAIVNNQILQVFQVGGEIVGISEYACEPYKPTERGKAQLMDIVFATYKKIGMSVGDANTYKERTGKLLDGLILEDRHMLINLAAEVL